PFVPQIDTLDVRAHALQNDKKPRARRVHTNVLDEELAAFGQYGCGDKERGAGGIAGNGKLECWNVGMTRRFEDDRAVPLMNPQAQMSKESLRVVARAVWFADGHRHIPRQSGKQNRTLHLGARDGTRIGQAAESPTANREWQAITALRDVRAHLSQRLGDPPHRPPAQRCIPGEGSWKLLSCENPQHEARGGP